MFALILLLGLRCVNAYQLNSTDSDNWTYHGKARMVGGQRAEFLEIAALLTRDSRTVFCGADLLTARHALSAANCLEEKEPSSVLFTVGHNALQGSDSRIQVIPVTEIVIHQKYDAMSKTNDIALILIEWEVVIEGSVRPACLPLRSLDISGFPVAVVGWSWDEVRERSELRQLMRTVIPHSECSGYYGLQRNPPLQICTDVLQEDSPECQDEGTDGFWPQGLVWQHPITRQYVLVGLVSYGLDCSSPTPGVSTDISAYLSWIQQAVQGSGVQGRICQI